MIMKTKYDISKEERTGVRYFIDPDAPVDIEGMKRFQDDLVMKDMQQMNASIDNKNKGRKDWKKYDLKPCNANVIICPYDEHPYTPKIEISSSGLILGGMDDPSRFKSPDSGEMDTLKRGIWCCKVIAVGPKCENVQVGDDIYCRFDIAVPLAFGDLGYYSIPEPNIISAIRIKE